MNRLHTTAAALTILALATPGCARDRTLPNQLAPAQVTTLAINSYLWRAAIDTLSFAPLVQANPSSGVIITDWYRDPKVPLERVKLRVSAAKQVYQNGAWNDAPVTAATVQKIEDIILTRARDLRRSTIPGADGEKRSRSRRS